MNRFNNAQEAFEYYYDLILETGMNRSDTKTIFNCGFYILNPLDRYIHTTWRKWNNSYAEFEWLWYLSGDRSGVEIAKKAKIWYKMMDGEGNVNSNYGYQWKRNNQLDKIIRILKGDPMSRKASISIYDGKEIDSYSRDTICTYAINFTVVDRRLCMSVIMRSNDLVYGFCNDQYCFSKLQEMVAKELGYPVGWYHHQAVNLHIYERHYGMKNNG